MIELKSISAGYGKSLVLDGVNASLEKGKLTCIVGENGCGKSTLLKSIIGILQVANGEMTVDGDDISTLGRGEVAKRIAYLAQSKSTPDMTVGQMVLHGRFPYLTYPRRYREEDRIAAKSAMEAVGIDPITVPIRGGTDGARLSYMGLPCPNLCTGGANFHSRFEYIPVEDMEKITQLLVQLLTNVQ